MDLHQFAETLRNARLGILIGGFFILLAGHVICVIDGVF